MQHGSDTRQSSLANIQQNILQLLAFPNAFINVLQSWTMTPVNPLGKHATVNSFDFFERITELSLALSWDHTEFIKSTFTS